MTLISNHNRNSLFLSKKFDIKCIKRKHFDKKKGLNKFFWYFQNASAMAANFENDETKNALPLHKFWNHEILLKLEKKLMFKLFWFLFEKKFKIIQDYLHLSLEKWFIHLFISPTEYSIYFMKKKNDKWKLCTDYKK